MGQEWMDRIPVNLRVRLKDLPQFVPPQPVFEVKLGWSEDYSKLFQGEFVEQTDIMALVHKTVATGRTLLIARGGGAKTIILHRLIPSVVNLGIVPVFVDLKNWSGEDYVRWSGTSGVESRADLMLGRFASPHVTLVDLDQIPADVEKLLILDGLNEVVLA